MSREEAFVLKVPKTDPYDSGVIRISPAYYTRLLELKRKTGLPLGRIAEQCIEFALTRKVQIKEVS